MNENVFAEARKRCDYIKIGIELAVQAINDVESEVIAENERQQIEFELEEKLAESAVDMKKLVQAERELVKKSHPKPRKVAFESKKRPGSRKGLKKTKPRKVAFTGKNPGKRKVK